MRVLQEDHEDPVGEQATLALWGKEWKLTDMVATVRPGVVSVSSQLGAMYVRWTEVCKVRGKWSVKYFPGPRADRGVATLLEFDELEPALDWAGEFLRNG